MSSTVVDINTVIIDDIKYVAVESDICNDCDLKSPHNCSEVSPNPGCSSLFRADKRYVSWKKSNVEPSTTSKFTLINKNKTYKLNFKP